MSKRPNYYQVHKNKKPRRRVENINWTPIYRTIEAATNLVNALIELSTAQKIIMNIPKYKQGNGNLATVGGVITGSRTPELIADNFGRNAKHIGKYEEITKSLKDRMNLTSVSSEELTKGNDQFLEIISKISISNNSILNAKAPN